MRAPRGGTEFLATLSPGPDRGVALVQGIPMGESGAFVDSVIGWVVGLVVVVSVVVLVGWVQPPVEVRDWLMGSIPLQPVAARLVGCRGGFGLFIRGTDVLVCRPGPVPVITATCCVCSVSRSSLPGWDFDMAEVLSNLRLRLLWS